MGNKIWQFLKLTRPLFLVGGMLLYLMGSLLAWAGGAAINWANYLLGQVVVTCIQLMTHYANEYYDLQCDTLNQNRTWFSGGSGVLVSGAIAPATAWWAAVLFGAAALILMTAGSLLAPPLLLIGIISLFAAWSYSGPPLMLARSGFGELSASLVVAFLVPLTGYWMQATGSGAQFQPNLSRLVLLCLPLVLIHFAMLIAFQIPDRMADEAVGKRTLAVRLGLARTVKLHNLSLFLAFCVILGLYAGGWSGALWMFLTLPLAIWQTASMKRFLTHAHMRFSWLTLGAISLFALTTTLFIAGLAVLLLPI